MRRLLLTALVVAGATAGCGGGYGHDDAATPRQSSGTKAGDDVVLHSIRPRPHRPRAAAPVELAER